MKVGTFLVSIFMCSAIFIADMFLHIGAINLFYIMLIMIVYTISKNKVHIFGATATAVILNGFSWFYNNRVTNVLIDVGGVIHCQLNYEDLFRAVTSIILVFCGFIFLNQKSKDDELLKINETLELRVLARTAKSENKVKILEKQIVILQNIKTEKTQESILKLDNVIAELKQLSKMEGHDGT